MRRRTRSRLAALDNEKDIPSKEFRQCLRRDIPLSVIDALTDVAIYIMPSPQTHIVQPVCIVK